MVIVSHRGAARWVRGHPWIYRGDVLEEPGRAGIVTVADPDGRTMGQALYSPRSEIRLRLLERGPRPVDAGWWHDQIAGALRRRESIDATAWRVVHAEGDGLPSLVVDRYDRWVVAQLLSAPLETARADILEAINGVLEPEGILLRNDAAVRQREGLPREIELVAGAVPETIEIREGAVRYLAAPRGGQKTGAFLDQRENRLRAGRLVPEGGSALDCFAYHGSFALHLAQHAGQVLALDSSAEALARGRENAALNGLDNIAWQQGDVFALLREYERAGRRFETIVLDPPAFAKSRQSVAGAVRGYTEINLRAMRLLSPGGHLLTASCSYHLSRPQFLGLLEQAAADSGRRIILRELLGQAVDHPEVLTIPETGYLKGAVLQAGDA